MSMLKHTHNMCRSVNPSSFLSTVCYGLFYNQGTSSVSFLVKNEMFCNSTTCFLLCYE